MTENHCLKRAFDTKAAVYERMRPHYGDELYQDLFRYVPIHPFDKVVEIGIGTGQATLPFLRRGCQLCAVEIGETLANRCKQKFRDYPHFAILHAAFEETVWSPNAYDLVYAATAFHWIDPLIGYTKVYAMLKSGGVFARFANHPYVEKDNKPFRDALQSLYARYLPGAKEPQPYTDKDAEAIAQTAAYYGFSDIVYHLYQRTRTFNAKEYTALLSTYSDHIAMKETLRTQFFSHIEDVINQFGGIITITDIIDLELARKP